MKKVNMDVQLENIINVMNIIEQKVHAFQNVSDL